MVKGKRAQRKDEQLVVDYSAIDREAIEHWMDTLWQTKGFIDWVKKRDFDLLKTLGTLLPPESYHCYIGRRAELLDLALEAKRRYEKQQEEKTKKNTIVIKVDTRQPEPLTMA